MFFLCFNYEFEIRKRLFVFLYARRDIFYGKSEFLRKFENVLQRKEKKSLGEN